MPRARTTSWLAQAIVAILVTPSGTSVVPKTCLTWMVLPSPWPEELLEEFLEEPQAARRAVVDSAAVPMRKDLRETDTGPLLWVFTKRGWSMTG